MSSSTFVGQRIDSLGDAKLLATHLRNALEEVGASVPPTKLLEVVARLCGARHYEDLRRRLEGTPGPDRNVPSVEVRLLTLPEILLLTKAGEDGPLVGQLQFWDKNSASHWYYVISPAALKPAALEAARRLVLGLPLRPTDAKWIFGRSREASVIDDEKATAVFNFDTRALAGAAYLGEGNWGIGSNYLCRLLVNDALLIERLGIPVSPKTIADETEAARRFAPPPDFASAHFEAFTVNIETRLMLRCLTLPDSARVLESLRLVGQRWRANLSDPGAGPRRLRAALLRADERGRVQVVRVTGNEEHLLAALSWEGTQWYGTRESTVDNAVEDCGSSCPGLDYSGDDGLDRIWREIRHWVTWCESAPGRDGTQRPAASRRSFQEFLLKVAEARTPLSSGRRADIEKWVARGRTWEQQPDETGTNAGESAEKSS